MFCVNLNCWFCNEYSKVSIFKRNSWTCAHCDQYNGFNNDGDYNQEIKGMHSNSNELVNKRNYFQYHILSNKTSNNRNKNNLYKSTNCLCDRCNLYQQLKIEKLKNFNPQSEETYDFELNLYKQYLEKIYDLCDICKKKVKFEITKQDGVLKHYLLKLGKFKYYFESNHVNDKLTNTVNETSIGKVNANQRTSLLSNSFDAIKPITHFLIYIMIFSLATVSIISNDYQIENGSMILMFNNSLTCMVHNNGFMILEKIRQFIFVNYNNFLGQNVNYFKKFESSNEFINYLNSKITFNLILIYMMSCMLIITSANYNKKVSSIKYSLIIWLASIFLILLNHEEVLTYFNQKSDHHQRKNIYKHKSLLILLPIIQLAILTKLFGTFFKFTKSSKDKQDFNTINFKQKSDNHVNYNPFMPLKDNSKESKAHNHLKKNLPAIKYMPTISRNNESIFEPSLINSLKCSNSVATKTIIKPAKFKPTLSSIFSAATVKNSKLNESFSIFNKTIDNSKDDDDDDESSIVSGITNLYLNKTQSSFTKLVEQPKLNNFSSFNLIKSASSNYANIDDDYSFYQTNTITNYKKSLLDANYSKVNFPDATVISNKKTSISGKKFSMFDKCSLIISKMAVGLNAFILSFFLYKWYISEMLVVY